MPDESDIGSDPTQTKQPTLDQLDWFLQGLVRMTNTNSDIEIGITLQVGGLLVSGRMTSGANYFEGIAREFAASFPGQQDDSEAIEAAFVGYVDIYKKPSQTTTTTYIHLKEARFFNVAGNAIPDRGVWWRGRLSEVSGFVIGTLSRD